MQLTGFFDGLSGTMRKVLLGAAGQSLKDYGQFLALGMGGETNVSDMSVL